MKTVWIDEEKRIVSFTVLSDGKAFRAEKDVFWQHILSLMRAGYRVQ